MSASFEDILAQVKEIPTKKLSVAAAQDLPVMEAVFEAKERGIAEPILVGDEPKIREIAGQIGWDLDKDGIRIIHEPDVDQAALTAVKLVHDKEADMYMKGALESKTFLRSVLNKEVGLRTGKMLSHVCVFEIQGIKRLLFLTDVAFWRTRSRSSITWSRSAMPAAFTIRRLLPLLPLRWSIPRCRLPLRRPSSPSGMRKDASRTASWTDLFPWISPLTRRLRSTKQAQRTARLSATPMFFCSRIFMPETLYTRRLFIPFLLRMPAF